MPKLARRKSTQEWIKDFQQRATIAGLLANAAKIGIPADDIEIIDVTDAEYAAAESETYAAIRAATATAEQLEIDRGKAIAEALNLDAVKARRLRRYLDSLR